MNILKTASRRVEIIFIKRLLQNIMSNAINKKMRGGELDQMLCLGYRDHIAAIRDGISGTKK